MIISKLTEETRDEILSKAKRCTEATLAAFGIDGYPLKGSGCLVYLEQAGYKLTPLVN